ncbi:hypothetical protein OIU76_029804 [Salix suchowensis]|nr:hypothetical protein OIU76_029804 [Salix suchowensis]
MVVNGRPIKRMKRRVTADLYNFLTFPASSSSSPPPPDGPFRANVRSFLTEHALLSPPSSLFPHLLTWQISFRVGDLVECGGGEAGPEVVSLDVVEEDVARSRSVYCDQCRVVGELTQLELLKNALFSPHAFSSLAICWSGRETRELPLPLLFLLYL